MGPDSRVRVRKSRKQAEQYFRLCKEDAILHQQKEELLNSKVHTTHEVTELTEYIQKSYDEQLQRMTEMVESKLKETSQMLQQELAQEKAARLIAEKNFQDAKRESDDEIRQLKEAIIMLGTILESIVEGYNNVRYLG